MDGRTPLAGRTISTTVYRQLYASWVANRAERDNDAWLPERAARIRTPPAASLAADRRRFPCPSKAYFTLLLLYHLNTLPPHNTAVYRYTIMPLFIADIAPYNTGTRRTLPRAFPTIPSSCMRIACALAPAFTFTCCLHSRRLAGVTAFCATTAHVHHARGRVSPASTLPRLRTAQQRGGRAGTLRSAPSPGYLPHQRQLVGLWDVPFYPYTTALPPHTLPRAFHEHLHALPSPITINNGATMHGASAAGAARFAGERLL